jgi:phosphatidylglycerophosphate synthase
VALLRTATIQGGWAFGLTGVALAVLSWDLARQGGGDWRLPAGSLIVFALVAALALPKVTIGHPYARFGPANLVTTIRAGLTCLFAGVALNAEVFAQPAAGWAVFALAITCMLLDGADGWLARRSRLCSPFGARFDIEIDALHGFLMCATAAALGKAGPWVMAIGAMRYVYGLAAIAWPVLRGDPGPSLRRKVIGVAMGVVQCALLLPAVQRPLGDWLAALALAALAWSFGADALLLLRRRGLAVVRPAAAP